MHLINCNEDLGACHLTERLIMSMSGEFMSRLDSTTLQNIRDLEAEGSPGLLDQLVDLFFQTAGEALSTMQEALKSGRAVQVRDAAHSLKSSAAGLGARELAAVCQKLETYMSQGRLDNEVRQLIQQIRKELESVGPALKKLKSEVQDES